MTAGVAVRKLRDARYDLILCEYHRRRPGTASTLLEDLRHNAVIPCRPCSSLVTGERQYERVVSAAGSPQRLHPQALRRRHPCTTASSGPSIKREAFMPAYRLIELGNVPDAIAYCAEAPEKPQWQLDFLRLRAELTSPAATPTKPQKALRAHPRLHQRAVGPPQARRSLFMQRRYAGPKTFSRPWSMKTGCSSTPTTGCPAPAHPTAAGELEAAPTC